MIDRIFQIDHDKNYKIIKQKLRKCPNITQFLEEQSTNNEYDELSKEYKDLKLYSIEMLTFNQPDLGQRMSMKITSEV